MQLSKYRVASLGIKGLRVLLLVMGTVACSWDVSATHVIGGDITYRSLGGDQYEIRVRVRRDCFLGAPLTEFDNPASIGIFRGDNFSLFLDLRTPLRTDDTLNQHLISDCTIAGMDVCVEETIYVDTVSLPFLQAGYIIAYQRCCRNATLQNILDPLNTGMTLVAFISAEAQLSQNSSPQFGEFPPIYICVDRPISFDFSVTDVDGDSIVYELFTPFLGATDPFPRPQPPPTPPYDTVVWRAPYSLQNLLGGPDPVRIDRHTGLLTGTPVLIGQFLVGVRVLSYRNGQLIAAVTREWQYNVRACRDVPVADITASLLNCTTLTVNFNESSQHADEYRWIFDYNNPGSATSNLPNPTYTFPSDGFFDVALIVNDSDSICFDTVVVRVGVFESELVAAFSLDIPDCATSILLQPADLSAEPHPDYDIVEWSWLLTYPGTTETSALQNPSFTITEDQQDVTLTLTVTSGNGCTATMTQMFSVNVINVPFAADTLGVCLGSSVTLVNGNPDFTYIWTPTEGLDLSVPSRPVASPAVSTTYLVTVTDGICVVTDSVHVDVRLLPDVSLADADTSCFGAPLVLNPGGAQGFTYQWSPPQFLNNPNLPNPIAQVNTTTVFYVTITDQSALQCQRMDSILVVIPPDIDLGNPPDTAYCDNPPITLNATNPELEYTWFNTQGSVIGTGPQITLQPNVMTTYIILGRDVFGCEVQTTVTLSPTFFNLTVTSDQRICLGETTVIGVQNNDPSQTLTYLWTPQEGIIGPNNQATIVVMPTETTTYTVQVVNAALGCIEERDITVNVNVFTPSPLEIFINKDTIILTESFVLSTNQSPNNFFFWDGPGIVNPNLPVITATPLSAGVYTYSVTITDQFGCRITGTISSLTVLNPDCNMDDVFVPNAFSPNGDGQNDVLFVYGNFISALELRIFNRFGEQVFVTRDQNIGWDGTFKGKELWPDVYGYYLMVECPPDKRYFTKGNITLFK